MIEKPAPSKIPDYYLYYINLVPETELIAALEASMEQTLSLFTAIPAEKAEYRYAPGKWTVKEVVAHINDAERVFAYRALRFSRGDATPLPGFDENLYAPNANTGRRPLAEIADEYRAVRTASAALFRHLNEEMLDLPGKASGYDLTPRAIGWMIAGHNLHHLGILRERYS
jgi:hypothetical protein